MMTELLKELETIHYLGSTILNKLTTFHFA